MPYLPSDAAKKSQLYNNIINGDTREYQEEINDLKGKQQVSASIDANSPLRDEDGVLVSFESETPGISLEEDFEEVRLENKQFFFTGQIDNQFTYYFQPLAEDTTDTTTTTNTKEVEFALTLRDYLIQFVNETDLTSQQIYYTINYYNSLMRIEVKETMHKVGKNLD